jgi:hypothetical protein
VTRSEKPRKRKKRPELPHWILDLQERHKRATRKQFKKIFDDAVKHTRDTMKLMDK